MKAKMIYLILAIVFSVMAATSFVSMFFIEDILNGASWQVVKGGRLLLFVLCIASIIALVIVLDAQDIHNDRKALQEEYENAPATENSKRA